MGGQQTILGGYATVGGNNWAVTANSGSSNIITGLATYNTGFSAGTDVDAVVGASTPGAMTVNSLRFNSAGAYTVDATGGLTVASGGILVTSGLGTTNGVTFNNGTLTSANGTDLIVINNNGAVSTGAVTINSQITGGSGMALTKSGSGYLVLGNTGNNYGKTYLNNGILQASSPGNLGSGDITISNNPSSGTVDTRLEFTAGGIAIANNIIDNSVKSSVAGVGTLHYNGPAGGFVTLNGNYYLHPEHRWRRATLGFRHANQRRIYRQWVHHRPLRRDDHHPQRHERRWPAAARTTR